MKGLELPDDPNNPCDRIDVLIGSDFYRDFMSGDTIIGDKGPIPINSKLGWLLSGPIGTTAFINLVAENTDDPLDLQTDDQLTSALRQFWETESLGINPDNPDQDNTHFLRNIECVQGQYQVSLPWKRDTADVHDHCRLKTHLLRKPQVLKEYDHVIKEQLSKGIMEPVNQPPDVYKVSNSLTHYLPHHAVVRQDRETTKIRVVYDGSARDKDGSPSLNDCLLTGPNYVPMLFDILLRFRTYPIALTGDIEKAFLVISIAEDDRDALQFL